MVACFSISASNNTRRAYWTDVRHWFAFCEERNVDPAQPPSVAVIAWTESMRLAGTAPKTNARRIAALSSVYDRLRRDHPAVVPINPFSIENGPEREVALPLQPTPVASPEAVRAVLATCDASPDGLRDAAIIRVLWATGARRASLTAMTFERLRRDRTDFVATLVAKGNKEVRALICGRAATALAVWLDQLRAMGIVRGHIWRTTAGAVLREKDVWRMLRRRAKHAGIVEQITPHTFRVAFLTFNPAGLESKQDAAGHADPATTRLYDRDNWRGREAFEAMPEVEDL